MRKRLHPLCFLLLLPTLFLACTGRSDVISEMNRYTSPPIYRAETPPVTAGTIGVPALPPPTGEIDLRAEKEKWEKILQSPTVEDRFYSPDNLLLEKLNPAFTDDAACRSALKDGFTLETLELLVWGRNPSIAAADHALKATLETYSQAANLEDILRQYGAFGASLMTGIGTMSDMEGIDKRYPFPGIISLKGNIVNEEVRIAREDLEIARRAALTQARKAFWDLKYAAKAVEITSASLSLLKSLEASTAKRFETGDAPVQSLSSVSVQKQKRTEELTSLREEKRTVETRIRALLGLPSDAAIGTPGFVETEKPLPSPEALSLLAGRHRQELRKTRAMIARMAFMIEMAETEIRPGFTSNLSLSENRAANQTGTMRMTEPFAVSTEAGMGAGLPFNPGYGLSSAYIQETKRRLSALKQELAGEEALTTAMVREAWLAADQAFRDHRLLKDRVTPFAKLDLTASAKALESGAMPFSEFVGTATTYFETRLAVEKSIRELGRSIAGLKEVTGISWEKEESLVSLDSKSSRGGERK